MADLTIEQTNILEEIVLHYLQGEDLSVVGIRLQTECAELKKNGKSLYKLINLDKAQDDPFITAIFGSLNIKKIMIQRYQDHMKSCWKILATFTSY